MSGLWSGAPVWGIVCLCCLTAAFAVQMFYYWGIYCSIFRRNGRIKKERVAYDGSRPGVSVIICAKNEAGNLSSNLPYFLKQHYRDYEVIVVDDGSDDDTPDVLKRFSAECEYLKVRTIPRGAKFTASKKFALSLGIKAAENDILLFSDADCRPASEEWIATMVRNFTPETQIVLGYGGYEARGGFASYAISYDTVTIAMQYMGYALFGRPYMGVGRNLAFRKSFFNGTRGYASHLDLRSGDDDLFVNEYATGANARVEFSAAATTVSKPKESLAEWRRQKNRHLSTYSRYKTASKLMLGGELASRTLFYALFIACIVTLDPAVCIAASALFLIRAITQYAAVNSASALFGDRPFKAGVIFLDIFVPIFNFVSRRSKNVRKW